MPCRRKSLFIARLSCALCAAIAICLAASSLAAQGGNSSSLNSPLSGGLLMARALRSGAVKLPGVSIAPLLNASLTCTPAPCVLNNVRASSGSRPVNDSPIAINPKNASQIATAGNDYNCGTLQGFHTSGDGGSTFHHACLLAATGYTGSGDPFIAYDQNNNLFAGGIDCLTQSCSTTSIVISKSTNNGTSYPTPVIAVNPLYSGGIADKPWLEIDTNLASTRVNTLYLSTTQFDTSSNSTIAVSHSTNAGSTWSAAVAVDSKQIFPNVDQFSDLAVAKNGTVYVTWLRCTSNGSGCGGTAATVFFSRSTDGGNTWSAPLAVGKVNLAPNPCGAFFGCLPNAFDRVSNIPVVAVDNSTATTAGALYIATYSYNTTTKWMRVQVVRSTNGGSTWSTPVLVAPSTAKNDEFFPWLNVSSTGVVGVTWLDRRNDASNLSYQAYAAFSTTGGTSFTNAKLATASSNPNNDGFGGNFLGDYTGNSWTGTRLYAGWPDTRTGTASVIEVGGYQR
jgi:hypothetical protein